MDPFRIFFGLIAVSMIAMIVFGIKTYSDDMAECMADGHKQYECRAMIDRNRIIVEHR